MSHRVAMVGANDVTLCDPEALALWRRTVIEFARQGITVATLPAHGACQLAAELALVSGGTAELFIPYYDYNFKWVERVKAAHGDRVIRKLFDPGIHAAWVEANHKIHPEHKRWGGTDIHFFAAIYGLVVECDGVIALPREGGHGIGVQAAVRIARALQKPLLVLTEEADREMLRGMLK